jgi:hypothetical protein
MENDIPNSNDSLFSLARAMHAGMVLYGDALDILANPALAIFADLGAATGAQDQLRASRTSKTLAIAGRDAKAEEAQTFIKNMRHHLEGILGSRFNSQWAQLGFKNGSLAIPNDVPGLLEILRASASYWAAHVAHEKPADQLTHQRAGTLEQELDAAASAVRNCESDVLKKKNARNRARKALAMRLRGAIQELAQKLDPLDERWAAFGLNAPGESERPAQVQGVTAQSTTPGQIQCAWLRAARASRYRIKTLVVGKDQDFVKRKDVYGTDIILAGFTPGDVVKIVVVALNVEEGDASEAVEVTVARQAAA